MESVTYVLCRAVDRAVSKDLMSRISLQKTKVNGVFLHRTHEFAIQESDREVHWQQLSGFLFLT